MVDGYSDFDGEATGTTTLPAPTLGSLEVTGDDIQANYTRQDNSTDGSVVIEVSTDSGSTWSDAGTQSDLGASSVTAVDLLDETTYTVRVSRRTDHATAESGNLQATTEPFTGINVAARSVSFGWENPDGITQDGYTIERRQVGVTSFEQIADVGPSVGAYTDSGLIPGTEYEYRVTAYTSGGGTEVAGQGTFTTLGGGGQPRVGSTGWSVSVVHPVSGRIIRPDVINPRQVQYLPGPNMMPEIRLPVRRAPSWLESEFDNNPDMTVHLDGEELPIDELVNVEHEEGQTLLIGEGGTELRKVVDVEYNAERRPVAATSLVDANTTYSTVNNAPGPETDTRVVQDPSGGSDLQSVSSFGSGVPLTFTGGGVKPAQTCFTTEAEDYTTGTASVGVFTGFSNNDEGIVFSNSSDYAEYEFSVNHDIAGSDFELFVRAELASGGVGDPISVSVNGESIGRYESSNSTLEWLDTGNLLNYSAPSDLTVAGNPHTVRFERSGTNDDRVTFDVVAPADGRFSYTLDNTLTNGYLDGPETHPDSVDAVFDAYESAFSIVGGSVTATVNDITASQALALSNDRGASYPISATNTTSVNGSFSSPGGTLTLKATLGRYSPSGAQAETPRFGYDAQRLDAYELSADIEFESLLIDDEFGNSLNSVLSDILNPRYAWRYSIENGTPTITIDEPGNSVASRGPEISDATIQKRIKTFDRVTIKGSKLRAEESFQASTSFVDLNRDDIVPGSEAVTDDSGTQFTKDVDYEMNYNPGEIRILNGGNMVDTQEYNITYDYGVSATHTVPDATGAELVRTIPGVTSDRQAEQIAYVLAEVYPGVATPRYEGEIVVPRFTQSFDPLEGLQLADFELPDAARPLSIRGEPELTPLGLTLRLGGAPSLEESLRGISEQVSAISDRV